MTATAQDAWFRKNTRQIIQIQVDPKSKELGKIIQNVVLATGTVAKSVPGARIKSIDANSSAATIKIELDGSTSLIQYSSKNRTIDYATRIVN